MFRDLTTNMIFYSAKNTVYNAHVLLYYKFLLLQVVLNIFIFNDLSTLPLLVVFIIYNNTIQIIIYF